MNKTWSSGFTFVWQNFSRIFHENGGKVLFIANLKTSHGCRAAWVLGRGGLLWPVLECWAAVVLATDVLLLPLPPFSCWISLLLNENSCAELAKAFFAVSCIVEPCLLGVSIVESRVLGISIFESCVPGVSIVEPCVPGVTIVVCAVPGVSIVEPCVPGVTIVESAVLGVSIVEPCVPGVTIVESAVPGVSIVEVGDWGPCTTLDVRSCGCWTADGRGELLGELRGEFSGELLGVFLCVCNSCATRTSLHAIDFM